MVILRGKKITPVRPGKTIKGVLMGEIPLASGEYVHEASISDIHGAYRALIMDENQKRPKLKRLRGMTSSSFKTLFRFARLLGLVEHVRDEPRHEPSWGELYRVERNSPMHIVKSERKIFQLTEKGKATIGMWDDLCASWRKVKGTIS